VRVTKKGKLFNPDNYDIGDMRSDDSTDDDSRPKKSIPTWARSKLQSCLTLLFITNKKLLFNYLGFNLKVALAQQTEANIDTAQIFPGDILLQDPDLSAIFKIKRARFDKRTSSAIWKTPPANHM
jgi:inner centromere protein